MSSYAIGYPIVTGCHNTHRVTALREVGGFAAHEADDLLITIKYRAAGWKGVYVPERLAAGLTPTDMLDYLKQQRRWARSVLDVKMRIFPTLGRALPLPERVFSFVHGLYYLHGLGSALSAALLSFMLVTGRTPGVFSVATGWRVVVLFAVLRPATCSASASSWSPGANAGCTGGRGCCGWRSGRTCCWPSATRSPARIAATC